MIKITYTKNSIQLSGHANQAKKGKDIVCAAASGIFFGSIGWFNKKDIKVSYIKPDTVRLDLVKKTKANQAFIALIVKQLKPVAYSYKKYVTLNKGK